jgi:hypothetical protein
VKSGTLIVTEAVCREWLNAMSGTATRHVAAFGYEQLRREPRVELMPHSTETDTEALRLFTARSDKNWSLTDCLSFVVMERRGIREALTADSHFDQAGFRAILCSAPPAL